MSNKLLVGRTTQGTIRLEREILPREATCLEGNGNQRFAIATGGGLLLVGLGQRRSKLGGAYGIRLQLMTQFQTEVPHPLGHQLPTFLAPGRVRAPSVGVDLLIFIRERWLKGATMQVQLDDIGGGEGVALADS